MKLSHKDRAYDPSPDLQTNLRAAVKQFLADFDGSSEIEHGPTKGEAREIPVQEFFRKRLPRSYRIDKGSVVDLCGATSPSADVLISDQVRGFPLRDGASVTLAAEALLATVEVKSRLNSGEVKSIFEKAESFKALRPFRKPLAERRTGGRAAGDGDRIFYCVFAYDTDLTNDDWASKEYTRFARISKELVIPISTIDRVYVLGRGLLIPNEGRGLDESEMPGSGLLQFYMHMLNFLRRENGRRDDVPFLDYAGRMTKGWQTFRRTTEFKN
jgi:hypothetical protein